MENFRQIRADEVDFDLRPQLSRVFVEGFYTWIKHFHKDKKKLTEAFTHVFDLKHFFVTMDGDTVAGMVACTHGYAPIALNRKTFVKVLGLIRGNIAYFMLKRHMIRNAYPFSLSPKTGSIEFVATASEYQRRGIARDLILHTMGANPYDSYVLEVADTNKGAVSVYEKLGFKEIKRIKAPRGSGVNFFLYMRREFEENANV